MTLREQFEKHRNVMRPCEPYLESENPEQWVRVLKWQEEYSDWLEKQLQNTSSNSDYAKCKIFKSCKKCDHNVSTNPFHIICDLD